MHPRVVIPTGTLAEVTNVISERNTAFVSCPLIEVIIKSRGLPVILPSVATSPAPSYLSLLDGIILAERSDIDPTFFNEELHQKLGPTCLK